MVRNLPAVQETWVPSLSLEDSLEESMATHSTILAWEIPWTEEPSGLQAAGLQRLNNNFIIANFSPPYLYIMLKKLQFVFSLLQSA